MLLFLLPNVVQEDVYIPAFTYIVNHISSTKDGLGRRPCSFQSKGIAHNKSTRQESCLMES